MKFEQVGDWLKKELKDRTDMYLNTVTLTIPELADIIHRLLENKMSEENQTIKIPKKIIQIKGDFNWRGSGEPTAEDIKGAIVCLVEEIKVIHERLEALKSLSHGHKMEF